MAKRLGNETVQHWTPGMEQYGKPRQDTLVAELPQCWMEYNSRAEGETEENLTSVLSSIWVPAEVNILDADDYFVWTRRPNEKYRVTRDIARWYDRRGNLRACVIPVEVLS